MALSKWAGMRNQHRGNTFVGMPKVSKLNNRARRRRSRRFRISSTGSRWWISMNICTAYVERISRLKAQVSMCVKGGQLRSLTTNVSALLERLSSTMAFLNIWHKVCSPNREHTTASCAIHHSHQSSSPIMYRLLAALASRSLVLRERRFGVRTRILRTGRWIITLFSSFATQIPLTILPTLLSVTGMTFQLLQTSSLSEWTLTWPPTVVNCHANKVSRYHFFEKWN